MSERAPHTGHVSTERAGRTSLFRMILKADAFLRPEPPASLLRESQMQQRRHGQNKRNGLGGLSSLVAECATHLLHSQQCVCQYRRRRSGCVGRYGAGYLQHRSLVGASLRQYRTSRTQFCRTIGGATSFPRINARRQRHEKLERLGPGTETRSVRTGHGAAGAQLERNAGPDLSHAVEDDARDLARAPPTVSTALGRHPRWHRHVSSFHSIGSPRDVR
eukprot:946840-Rhodomonas_salina.3